MQHKLLRHNLGQIKVILGVGDLENVPKVIVPSLFLSILRNIPRAIGLTWRFNSRFSSFDKSSFSECFAWNWCFSKLCCSERTVSNFWKPFLPTIDLVRNCCNSIKVMSLFSEISILANQLANIVTDFIIAFALFMVKFTIFCISSRGLTICKVTLFLH